MSRKRDRFKKRYGNDCAFCGVNEANSLDHMVPRSLGGNGWIGNIIPACRLCNGGKGQNIMIPVRAFVVFSCLNPMNKITVSKDVHVATKQYYARLRKTISAMRRRG